MTVPSSATRSVKVPPVSLPTRRPGVLTSASSRARPRARGGRPGSDGPAPPPRRTPSHTTMAASTLRASQSSRRAMAATWPCRESGTSSCSSTSWSASSASSMNRSRASSGQPDAGSGHGSTTTYGIPAPTAASAASCSAPWRSPVTTTRSGWVCLRRHQLADERVEQLTGADRIALGVDHRRSVAHDQQGPSGIGASGSGRGLDDRARTAACVSTDMVPASVPKVVRRPDRRRRLVAGAGRLGLRRLHRQAVDQVVHGVAGVALHPPEGDVAPRQHQLDEGLPQVPVGHRLLLRVEPAPR